jgi:pimeloyl-ACP methyl ester carboxylesterase
VLLGGHSYGGAVITNAATSAPNVVGLVYVATFAPDEGENLGDVENDSKDSVLNSALVQYQYPAGPGGQISVEFAINPTMIREAFAADLPGQTTALMTAIQRPAAAAAFSDSSRPPAWRNLPSWGGGRHRRQGRRRRRRPLTCPAGGRGHRRGRGITRDPRRPLSRSLVREPRPVPRRVPFPRSQSACPSRVPPQCPRLLAAVPRHSHA